jgi:hypothetical protein
VVGRRVSEGLPCRRTVRGQSEVAWATGPSLRRSCGWPFSSPGPSGCGHNNGKRVAATAALPLHTPPLTPRPRPHRRASAYERARRARSRFRARGRRWRHARGTWRACWPWPPAAEPPAPHCSTSPAAGAAAAAALGAAGAALHRPAPPRRPCTWAVHLAASSHAVALGPCTGLPPPAGLGGHVGRVLEAGRPAVSRPAGLLPLSGRTPSSR